MGSVRLLKPQEDACPSRVELASAPDSTAHAADRFRRPFLEALPIAAGVFALADSEVHFIDANTEFENLDGSALVSREDIKSSLLTFLRSDAPRLDFELIDGDSVTGRQYSVRVARVAIFQDLGPRCLITLIDRTTERSTEKSLRREMFIDSLTGLPNRAGFGDQVEAGLNRSTPNGFAVLLVDLTRFSRINESIGSVAGDELLITVARRLLSAMRGGDVLARTGGNEFGVFVHLHDGADDAVAVATRVADVLSAPCRLSDLEIRVGCAIGCAVQEADCDTDELIRRAQFALKQAKQTDEIQVYQSRAHDLARQRFTIETSLRRAIEAEQLSLAFQPVIDLATGSVAGFEALARWHYDGKCVSPSTFIPVAEESGLIVPLGRWALDNALKTLVDWDRRSGGRITSRVAVNVSAIQIARDDLPGLVSDALAVSGVDPSRLMLELTESAIVADPERAADAMHKVREIGASIALDDFGTGYSNLAYLQRLPIDVLKIDQSFVTGMLGDRDKLAIVRAILSLADALGLRTTAEGVETEELSRMLAALGCTRGQGYVYARPLDADAAFEFWSRSNSAAT